MWKSELFAEKEAFFFSQVFPDNEVTKGQLTMELKRLRMIQDGVTWPKENVDLPVISYQSCECGDLSPASRFLHELTGTSQSWNSRKPVPWFSSLVSFTTLEHSLMNTLVGVICWQNKSGKMLLPLSSVEFTNTPMQRTT